MKYNIGIVLFLLIWVINAQSQIVHSQTLPFKSEYHAGENLKISEDSFQSDSIALRIISESRQALVETLTLPCDWTIPMQLEGKSVGVYVRTGKSYEYKGFFRVVNPHMLTSYDIRHSDYKGLPVFQLNGGMSPEFAVQKSLENLCGGISHTWDIGPGGGPAPVWGTMDFLQKSIAKTIDLYDTYLGQDTPVENVIIGTGVPTVSYLSAVTKSVFLPIQYLVSVNSIKEVQSIVEYSAAMGLKTYATLGYDASMDNVGVAWIKLLDMPEEYLDFLSRHKVKNVFLTGVGEKAFGESFVRKYIPSTLSKEEYADGSVYILYTQSGSEEDLRRIMSYIKDYDEKCLDDGRMIADWESGIINKQIKQLGKSIQKHTGADVYSIVSPVDMGCMYNVAMDLALAYAQKNRALMPGKLHPNVVFNEYLISHPMYELMHLTFPILYWQFVPVKSTVDRLFQYGVPHVEKKFPDFSLSKLSAHLNGRLRVKEMKKELEARGIQYVTSRVDGVEEVWNLEDGVNAPCEFVAKDIVENMGVEQFHKMQQSMKSLTVDEIADVVNQTEGVTFSKE